MTNPKTIGELLAAAKKSMVASHKKVVADLPEPQARTDGFFLGVAYAAEKFKEINDYSIVGPGCVINPEGFEAAAEALYVRQTGNTWKYASSRAKKKNRRWARAVLEAAEIVCAEERLKEAD